MNSLYLNECINWLLLRSNFKHFKCWHVFNFYLVSKFNRLSYVTCLHRRPSIKTLTRCTFSSFSHWCLMLHWATCLIQSIYSIQFQRLLIAGSIKLILMCVIIILRRHKLLRLRCINSFSIQLLKHLMNFQVTFLYCLCNCSLILFIFTLNILVLRW